MTLTPDTLSRHELIGLPVRVVESTDPGHSGTAGRVVRETAKTLVIAGASGVRQVPKRISTFEFTLDWSAASNHTDETAGPGTAGAPGRRDREAPGTASERTGDVAAATASDREGAASVTVDGDVLLARPPRRTEQGVDSQWR